MTYTIACWYQVIKYFLTENFGGLLHAWLVIYRPDNNSRTAHKVKFKFCIKEYFTNFR